MHLAKGLPLAMADRIQKMPGVAEVIRGLMDMVAFEKQGLFMVIVNGWEADCPVLDRVQVTAGRRLKRATAAESCRADSCRQPRKAARGQRGTLLPAIRGCRGL